MLLNIENKIKIILSLDDNMLLPASSVDQNNLFYSLYRSYNPFFEELEFHPIGLNSQYYKSKVLEKVIFNLYASYFFKTIELPNKCYKMIKPVRQQIWSDFKKPIKENEKLFNNIKNHYLTFINTIYSFSEAK